MPTAIIMTGGGIKGAVAAATLASDNDLTLIHVDYGQASASAELGAVQRLAASFLSASVLPLRLPHVGQLQQGRETTGSTGSAVRPGRAKKTHRVAGTDAATSATLVSQDDNEPTMPALRGLMPVLLSVGVQSGLTLRASSLAVGLSQFCDATHLGLVGDSARPGGLIEFLHAFNLSMDTFLGKAVRPRVDAPLLDIGYAEVIKLARRLEVPLDRTWTCHAPGPHPCKKCDACKARAQAFAKATVADPLHRPVAS